MTLRWLAVSGPGVSRMSSWTGPTRRVWVTGITREFAANAPLTVELPEGARVHTVERRDSYQFTVSASSVPTCAGPVYFGDQGIEVCEACGGCICCDFSHVDHSKAEYECLKDDEGVCHLRVHRGRDCQPPLR